MKKILSIVFASIAFVSLNSCDKDFEQLNVNPVQSDTLDGAFLFANAEFYTYINTLNFQQALVQQVITPFTGVLEGGNHNALNDVNSRIQFDYLFSGSGTGTNDNGSLKLLTDILTNTAGRDDKSNLYNMARIWKAFIYINLVDTYGDVPYSETGKAYLSKTYFPKYDNQELIYDSILIELDAASKALDEAKPKETNEIFYLGDIAKWRKLGNSILLRAAMRLSKVNPEKAQQYIQSAVAGGLMESNEDNAFVRYNSTFNNPTGNTFQGTEKANFYLAEPFLNFLKDNNDPRLSLIAVKYADPGNASGPGAADTDPANQQGMPVGYNESTIANAPDYPGKIGSAWAYSQVNRSSYGRIDAPGFFVTYSQTQLLLAEAVERGWATGDAASFYEAGVRAHMDEVAFVAGSSISDTDKDDYLSAHPYDQANALEQINTQYWVSSFMNGPEAWANFRRSGFPELTANPYPSADPSLTDGFVHRLVYPDREKSVNSENYQAAVSRQGADNMATRVFWDTE